MKDALYGGVNAAVLTPMNADLSVDLDRMAAHCRWLLANGCNGLGVLGTTGEANSLGLQERMNVLEGLIARGIPAARMMPGTGVANITDTWPPARSVAACAPPLYGMCSMSVCVSILKSSPDRWPPVPMPEEA